MVRTRVPMKLIDSPKRRNTTFMKRRTGIKKKAMELGRLCDIPTLLICFGPEGQLQTWPEDQREVYDIIHKYQGLSEMDRSGHRHDLGSLLTVQIKKLKLELDKVNHSAAAAAGDVSGFVKDMSEEELREFGWSLDVKLGAISERIVRLQENQDEIAKLQVLLNDNNYGSIDLDSIFCNNNSNNITVQFEECSSNVNGFWQKPNNQNQLLPLLDTYPLATVAGQCPGNLQNPCFVTLPPPPGLPLDHQGMFFYYPGNAFAPNGFPIECSHNNSMISAMPPPLQWQYPIPNARVHHSSSSSNNNMFAAHGSTHGAFYQRDNP